MNPAARRRVDDALFRLRQRWFVGELHVELARDIDTVLDEVKRLRLREAELLDRLSEFEGTQPR